MKAKEELLQVHKPQTQTQTQTQTQGLTGGRGIRKGRGATTAMGNGVEVMEARQPDHKAQAEDDARVRLMGISQAAPPFDVRVNSAEEVLASLPPAPPSQPPAVSSEEDGIRRSLMSISYQDVGQPKAETAQPLA